MKREVRRSVVCLFDIECMKTQTCGHFWNKGVPNPKSAENFGQGTPMHACVYVVHTYLHTHLKCKSLIFVPKKLKRTVLLGTRGCQIQNLRKIWGGVHVCMYVCTCMYPYIHVLTYIHTLKYHKVSNVRYLRTTIVF